MSETCPYCSAIFSVAEQGGGGICGACKEPINCPYCHKIVREERTTGTFSETLIQIPDSQLSQYLGITDDEWEELGVELQENTGHSDETVYNYWFIVPEGTSDEILDKTGWKIGDTIDQIPVDVVNTDIGEFDGES